MGKMTIEKWLADVHYDNLGTCIWNREKDGGNQMIADIRGWGAIQNEFKTNEEAEKFQDGVGEFIVQAIREKIYFKQLKEQKGILVELMEDIPKLSDEEIDDITNDIYADSIKVLPYTKFGIEEIAEHFTRGLKMYRQKIKEKYDFMGNKISSTSKPNE